MWLPNLLSAVLASNVHQFQVSNTLLHLVLLRGQSTGGQNSIICVIVKGGGLLLPYSQCHPYPLLNEVTRLSCHVT